jgi:cytochrome P450
VADAVRVGVERHAARVESLLPLPERFPSPGGLLDLLLAARDGDDQTGMTDQQLRDEVLTLLLAGHETTAIALSWTLWLLWRYPQVEATLCAEVDRVLRGRLPTTDDLPRLAYANHVVTESMRLYPPVWAFGREAVRDCELGGYRVAAGTTVVVSQWVLHRDPRHWRDPERFHPSRWAGGLARRLPPFAYLPFGGGPRRCLGGGFAMTEAVLLLAMITQRFRLTLAPGHPVAPWPTITLRPRHGLRMTPHARR